MHRRPATSAPEPSTTISTTASPASKVWDYSNTEQWGWIILVTTWAVFVIGMGSCFDMWDWVWASPANGNEAIRAPASNPTLPIPGYYPALIVLTGVVAWMWVFVAWVGMKYFRHAKIS